MKIPPGKCCVPLSFQLLNRDELKTEQDAVLADCEDLQALLTTLIKETTV